jgi:deoxyribodipyrimidine photo-lyase
VGDPAQELLTLARELGVSDIFATKDFASSGRVRDQHVERVLADVGVTTHFVDSPYLVQPGTVTTKTGTPCRVFSAFQRGWNDIPVARPFDPPRNVTWRRAASASLEQLLVLSSLERPELFGDLPDAPTTATPGGETRALELLADFAPRIDAYDVERDIPGLNATSRLSAHLRFGTLHPRQILAAYDTSTRGRQVFRSEVCWREFYADVLFHQPDSAYRTMQPSLEHLRWDTGPEAEVRFRTWARGETGYPLVDAGMRQLLEEGWMHNRVRMVCASFLVKHLHLDWRWGAKWFMWRLVDADLASNQHGWQWTAGTGTDAAPFHRIFNPTRQAERFDTEGTYVRRYVVELASTPAPQCLEPGGGTGLLAPVGYPPPMIDASVERDEALLRFRDARQRAGVSA